MDGIYALQEGHPIKRIKRDLLALFLGFCRFAAESIFLIHSRSDTGDGNRISSFNPAALRFQQIPFAGLAFLYLLCFLKVPNGNLPALNCCW
jgi:hypothetical protein